MRQLIESPIELLRLGHKRVKEHLKSSSVRRITAPGPHPMVGPTGLPEAATAYGSLMQLWTTPADQEGERDVVAFGHTGSDGTYAWAFPEEKTLVLYFTQSRGNVTGLRLEEVLGELLLGVPFDPIQAAPPLEPYLGYYFEGEGDRYRAIIRDGDGLALEILGRAVVPLVYVGDDRWKLKPSPANVIAFDRDPDAGLTMRRAATLSFARTRRLMAFTFGA